MIGSRTTVHRLHDLVRNTRDSVPQSVPPERGHLQRLGELLIVLLVPSRDEPLLSKDCRRVPSMISDSIVTKSNEPADEPRALVVLANRRDLSRAPRVPVALTPAFSAVGFW